MGSILGIINKKGESIDREFFNKVFDALSYWDPDHKETFVKKNVGLGLNMLFTSSNSKKRKQPYLFSESGCFITADARIDYKNEIASVLKKPLVDVLNCSDSELILRLYLLHGKDCMKFLFGDFTFAIWDSRINELFCARDHFGTRPFLYQKNEDSFIFSSEVIAFKTLPDVNIELTEEIVFDSILGIPPEKEQSAYSTIVRLPPAHTLVVNSLNEIDISQYWELSHVESIDEISTSEACSELRRLIENAVRERCGSSSPIGIELSGGLDSSAIAAMVSSCSEKNDAQVYSFSHVFTDEQRKSTFPFRDQRKEIRLVNDLFKIDRQFYITGQNGVDLIDAIEDSVLTYLKPICQGIGTMSYHLYKTASESGVRVLLSGFGGDEGVSSHARGFLNELVYKRKFKLFREQLTFRMKNSGKPNAPSYIATLLDTWFPFIRVFKVWYRIYFTPNKSRYAYNPIRRSLLVQHRIKRRFIKKTVGSNSNLVQEHQLYYLLSDHISTRLEESFLSTQKKKIEYRYPLLDIKVIEYYYSLPTELKHNQGFGRWIFRKAMEDILPPEICWRKRKNDPAIPYLLELFRSQENAFRELIENSKNTLNFHYIDYKKLNLLGDRIIQKSLGFSDRTRSKSFFNSIGILILQKWQREGKIDIGIKC